MRRRCGGTGGRPSAVSSSVSPSSADHTRRSGRSSPAIMLIKRTSCRRPDAPNRPVRRGPGSRTRLPARIRRDCSVDVDAQHGQFPCRRLVARRANHSEAISAAHRDQRWKTTTSRAAARVAVGGLDQRIDRGRDGLGLAGNVGDEGDGGAELTDRLGEAEHHAGEHARQAPAARLRWRTPATGAAPSVLDACAPAGGRSPSIDQPDRPAPSSGKRHDAAEPAPPRSSETRTPCRNDRRATRRPDRGGRRSAAANNR